MTWAGMDAVGVPGRQAGKQAYRSWVREHHPDRGGDPAVFAEGLERWRDGRDPAPGPRLVVVYRRRRGVAGWVGCWLRHRRWRRSARVR